MSAQYSDDYSPPAPVLEVFFGVPGERPTSGPFEAMLDTGADMTVAPKAILLDLGTPSLFEAQLRSPWGELHEVIIYLADLQIGPARLPGIYVAADETAAEITIGRNALNKLPLFLDGPKQVTEILDEAAVKRLRTRQARK